jgi:Glycosyl hydrolases family 25
VTHLGRDYSSFQGNLSDADCEGIDFAFVKATQGGDYKNPDAIQQCATLRKHGVAVGYYHFFDPTVPVIDQLHNFHLMASALGETKLPVALDSEIGSNTGWPDLAAKMMDFTLAVESWTNFVPNERSLSYVNINFYDNLHGFPWGRWCWLADPNPGAPHRPCLVLQGAPRPVSASDLKSVDPDTFLGTEAQWAQFTSTVGVPPVPAPPAADPSTYDALVPGYGIPGDPEVAIIGQMVNGSGLYRGRMAGGNVPVYAGTGNPTSWHTGFNLRTLPIGTPLAVLYSDLANVSPTILTRQF